MKRRGRLAGAAMVGIGLLASLPATALPATADTAAVPRNMFPNANTPWICVGGRHNPVGPVHCQTDNKDVTVYIDDSLEGQAAASIKEVLAREFAPTHLNIKYVDHPVKTGGAETDIIYERDSRLDAYGMTWCDDPIDNKKCDQHYVVFRGSIPSESTICHETGHAVGLTHGKYAEPKTDNNDARLKCMMTPDTSIHLGLNNQAWINETY